MDNHTCSRGWDKRCAASKGKKCTCACGGHNHGTSVIKTEAINHDRQLTVGDLVFIKKNAPMGGEIGYVYETYLGFDNDGHVGVSIITKSGRDTGGWGWDEQVQFLEYVGRAGWDYEFKNVIQLDLDFKAGLFNKVFNL